MKKTLGLGLVLLLLSNNAFATKARLLALGMDETDNEGSYYIDSVRNIFLNAANVNDFGNTLIFEWGDKGANPQAANTQASIDTDNKPKAAGGFLMNAGDYVWGLYLGNESNTSSLLRIVGSAEGSENTADLLQSSDNQVDLFLGSEANGIKWGANVVYTKGEDKENVRKDSGYAVRLGAATDSWDAFVNASVGGSAEGEYGATPDTHKFDGSIGIHVGGGYNVSEEGKVYAYIKQFGWEQTDSSPATVANAKSVDGSFTTYALGYGHTMKTDVGTFYSNIYYRMKEIEVKFASAAKAENTELPITFGYEAAATSWLTLRGSVTQNIMGSRKNDYSNKGLNAVAAGVAAGEFGANTAGKKVSQRDSTSVKAGASLNFGQLVVDGLIGTEVGGTPVSRTSGSSLKLDEVLARVGATYSF